MRLFLAADLDEGARASVAGAITRFRALAERDRAGCTAGVRWVDARNLHLTLHFLGEVDEGRLPLLKEAIAPALAFDRPRIGLAGWGVFPPKAPARVIWLGVAAGAGALGSAHASLAERLRAAGFTPEGRPFSPHLTVGRVKIPSGPHWERLARSMPPDPVCEWELHACTLFQSHVSPAGAVYRSLLSIPFAGAHASGVDEAEMRCMGGHRAR
jgi:2'-5' RNA ligase